MVHSVRELFLSLDYKILIPEDFVKVFNVNVEFYYRPYGYFNEADQSLVYNDSIPDGVYALIGKVSYPGKERRSYHTVGQFNILKIEGANLTLVNPMSPYIGLSDTIPFSPLYPLFRLGTINDYNEIKKTYLKVDKEVLTSPSIEDKIRELDINSFLYKLYALKLALIQYINLDRKLDGN